MHPQVVADRTAVARFNREAGVAAKVSHPNVAATYDFGETDDGLIYLAIEYVEGQNLRQLVEESHGLPMQRAAIVVRQVAEGLAAAHRMQIVHRDLKPDNILMTRDHFGGDVAKIVDFGIAKSVESRSTNVTGTGFLIGTPTYMSPEQVSGDVVGSRSDIFSLGLVAFYLLTGTLPYPDGSVQEIFLARLSGKPMPLAEARPDIKWPRGLQDALDRALASKPADRYQTVTEFGEDFARAIESEMSAAPPTSIRAPVAAPPPSRPPSAEPKRLDKQAAPAPSRSLVPFILVGTAVVAGLAIIYLVSLRGTAAGSRPSLGSVLWILVPALLGATAFAVRGAFRRARAIPSASAAPVSTPSQPRPQPSRAQPPVVAVSVSPSSLPAPPVPRRPASGDFTAILSSSDWSKPEAQQSSAPPLPPSRATAAETTGIFSTQDSATSPAFPLAIVVSSTVDPGVVGRRVKCDHFPFTVGRSVTADLSIPGDVHLSRIHVEVDRDDTGFVVRDRSTNGVYVNSRMLHDTSETIGINTTIQLTVQTSVRFVADVRMLPDLSGQLVENRYRLTRRLHESVKASTYLATHERLPQSFAVKVFSPVLMSVPQYRTEFRRQAELAARLQHPHICKVIDWGEATMMLDDAPESVAYLCSEYMGGGNLASRLGTANGSEPTVVADWVEKIASALQHAHDAGIVHGDVKPNCILFDAHDTPYLADFALAVEGTSSTRTVVGNPEYLAPEQWDAQPPSPRSDQYSLAVLSYFLFCGIPPYEGQADPAVRRRNFERGPVAAHEEAKRRGRDGVNRQVSAVLTRAMTVDPAARFESVLEFSRALTRSVSSKRNRTGATRIFLSYHRDTSAAWATHLSSALRDRHGYSVFLDTQSTDGAPKIPDRLKNEIRDCDVFVCLLGEKTLESKWVRQEIGSAAKFDKPMVPIFQEGFRAADAETKTRPGVRRLLNYSGVHLFDRKNVYVDDMIAHLNEQIQRLVGEQ
jgi:serine/threonine-protein kinase